MKKMTQKLVVILVVLVATVSCKKDEDENIIQPVKYDVSVNFDESFENKEASNVYLLLSSTTSERKYEVTTKSDGKATFYKLVPDTYNLSATLKVNKEQFKELFGYYPPQDEVTFNASAENITVNSQSELKNLVLSTSRVGDLVFKQIYYAGSDTKKGAMFRDLFFEIYNNSNETIYADKLYFAMVYGNTKSTVKPYTLSNGQYDWSKSINQTKGAKSNTDYTYADHIYQIPGTGKDYPIKPGESIVVAGTAINHKEPLTVTVRGKERTYTVKNPELTIDLSKATFELNMIEYFENLGKKPLATDIDNPSVPNLNITYNLYARELILDPLGRDSFILFRANDVESYDKLPNPQTTKITSKTKFYVQIPNSVIIDGVEVNAEDSSKLYPRRLNAAIDGGYAFVPKGKYSSQAIIRKVVKEVNGRKILSDTNNSTNDFEVVDIPVPFGWK